MIELGWETWGAADVRHVLVKAYLADCVCGVELGADVVGEVGYELHKSCQI